MKLQVLSLLAVPLLVLAGCSDNPKAPASSSPVSATAPAAISHAHGLAVDVQDPTKLYIATHEGLLVLQNDKDLARVGSARDDFMGFSTHSTNPQMFFSSGHPVGGGNMGFLQSTDGGQSWNKVSNGMNGPVDFHAMTVSPADPSIIYGTYNGLQRSLDGGQTWSMVSSAPSRILGLTAAPKDSQTIFAATTTGLMVSRDQGASWSSASEEIKGAVTTLAINPGDPKKMLSFSEDLGLATSSDGGNTWSPASGGLGNKLVFFIAYNKQDPRTVYLLTKENSIYKSTDGGMNWTSIR